MSQIKIIFFDIDGTLKDFGAKPISEKTLEALIRLKEKGIKICIATGRPKVTLPKFDNVEFDAYLTFNGSYCYEQSNIIFNNPICNEDVRKIIQNATNLGKSVSIATRERLVANGTDKDLAEYYSLANLKLSASEDFEVVSQDDVYQIMMGCKKDDYDAIIDGVNGAKITSWCGFAIDIIPANGSKGVGIKKILEYYHIDKSESMAFGDGNNDIEMLEVVGTGVAMGNASEELKAIADDICAHVSEDGIYHYLIKQGII